MTIREVEDGVRKLAPMGKADADLAWLFYLSGEGEERRQAEELLDVWTWELLQKGYARQILLDPPPAIRCEGPYSLGTVIYPADRAFARFGLYKNEWIRHLLIVGMSGSGKTNLGLHLVRLLHRSGTPVLVFDWKRNYRDLLQFQDMSTLRVLTVARNVSPFRFNPLIPPPGITAGLWLMKLVDVIKHAYFVGDGVEYLLRQGLDHLYEQCGYHDDTRHTLPLLSDVREFILKQRLHGRMSLWKASAIRVLESLCFRHGLGPVVNTPATLGTEFFKTSTILELDALAEADKIFLTEVLVLWLYEYRKTQGKREQLAHALVLEEAHHVLSGFKERSAGAETIMETCLRQIREFGEAVIVIDQEPTKLSNSVKANSATQIIFRLGSGRDIHDMALSLDLSSEERSYLQLLEIGHSIATHPRVQRPVHVRFPHVRLHKGKTSDDDVRKISSG